MKETASRSHLLLDDHNYQSQLKILAGEEGYLRILALLLLLEHWKFFKQICFLFFSCTRLEQTGSTQKLWRCDASLLALLLPPKVQHWPCLWLVAGAIPKCNAASIDLQVSAGHKTTTPPHFSLFLYTEKQHVYLYTSSIVYLYVCVYLCIYLSIHGCIQVRICCLKCCWFPASLLLFLGSACQDDDSHLFQQSSKCHFLWISQITPKVERQHLQIAVQRIYCFCYPLHSDKCIIQVHPLQFTSH